MGRQRPNFRCRVAGRRGTGRRRTGRRNVAIVASIQFQWPMANWELATLELAPFPHWQHSNPNAGPAAAAQCDNDRHRSQQRSATDNHCYPSFHLIFHSETNHYRQAYKAPKGITLLEDIVINKSMVNQEKATKKNNNPYKNKTYSVHLDIMYFAPARK